MAPSSPIEVAVHPDRALRAPEPVAAASASAAATECVADAAACAAPECSAPAPPAPAAPAPPAPAAPPEFSTEQQRELDGVLELLKCPVRQRILFALAAAND